jgi:hypothetical protein
MAEVMGLTMSMGRGSSDMITMISLQSSSGAHERFVPNILTGGEGIPSFITAVGIKRSEENVPIRFSLSWRTIYPAARVPTSPMVGKLTITIAQEQSIGSISLKVISLSNISPKQNSIVTIYF